MQGAHEHEVEGMGSRNIKIRSRFKRAQTCTGLQSKPSPTAPYSAVNANLQKFAGIFRHGADVALKQGVQEHEAKRMGK